MRLIQKIFNASLEAIRPDHLVAKSLHRDGNILTVGGRSFELKKNVHVVGFGKAVYGMAIGLNDIIHDHVTKGILSVPIGTCARYNNQLDQRFKVYEGAKNNLPDRQSLSAAMDIKDFAMGLSVDDLLFVLISGGGSALLPAPIEGITLEEKLVTIKTVANAGGSIQQLNTIRKHLSQLKGGGLALLSPSYNIISLIISDIVNDPLDLIASAPTVFDRSTNDDCIAIFRELKILSSIPENVISSLHQVSSSGNRDGREKLINEKCLNSIVGSNKIALDSAQKAALSDGYKSLILSHKLEGDAAYVGECLATLASNIVSKNEIDDKLLAKLHMDLSAIRELKTTLQDHSIKKLCLIFGGETTVKVEGSGRGGRNQHLVLSALKYLSENCSTVDLSGLTLMSAGTDGQDGPTDAAGALLDSTLCEHVRSNVCTVNNVNNFLADCGSYDFFSSNDFRSNYLIKTGLTGTNVMDIQIILIDR